MHVLLFFVLPVQSGASTLCLSCTKSLPGQECEQTPLLYCPKHTHETDLHLSIRWARSRNENTPLRSSVWVCDWWCQPARNHLHQALSGSLAGGADGSGFFVFFVFFFGLLPIWNNWHSAGRLCVCSDDPFGQSDWVQEAVSLWSCTVLVYYFWTELRKRCRRASECFITE